MQCFENLNFFERMLSAVVKPGMAKNKFSNYSQFVHVKFTKLCHLCDVTKFDICQ